MLVIDPMESASGWTARLNADTVERTTNHAAGRYAVEFNKTGTGAAGAMYRSIDLNAHLWKPDDRICLLVYVSAINRIYRVYLLIGADASNYSRWQWLGSGLTAGRFTLLTAKLGDGYTGGEGMDLMSLKYLEFVCETKAVDDALDNIAVDQIYLRRAHFTQT